MGSRQQHTRHVTAQARCAWLAMALAGVLAATGRAAELVTLHSGFTITCIAREQISQGTVRLYLPAADHSQQGGDATNYMDVPMSAVARVEAAADSATEAQVPAPKATKTVPSARSSVQPSIEALLQRSGASHNVNAALLSSVVHAESGGNAHAVSRAGARGLMQLMPGTAAELGVHDSFAPADNLDGGSNYLDRLLTRYHDNVVLALAAYNAGPAAVDRYRGVPPFRETQLYVARVLREFNRLVVARAAAPATASVLPTAGR